MNFHIMGTLPQCAFLFEIFFPFFFPMKLKKLILLKYGLVAFVKLKNIKINEREVARKLLLYSGA